MRDRFEDIPDPWSESPLAIPPPEAVTPGPSRGRVTRRRAALIVLALAALMVPPVMGVRTGWTAAWASLLALAGCGATALALATRAGRPPWPAPLVLAALAAGAAAWGGDGSASGSEPMSVAACVAVATAMAVWVCGWSLAALRGGFVADVRTRAALLAAGAASSAAVVLGLRCSASGIVHLLVGHVGAPLLLVLAGALAASRWLRVGA